VRNTDFRTGDCHGITADCSELYKGKVSGRRISTGALRYVVPKGAVVKKVKDVDYQEFRILLHRDGKWEVLKLFWGVNASPFPPRTDIDNSAKYVQRTLKLSDGSEGIDARGTLINEGREQEWRSAGVNSELANYRYVSSQSVGYFDAIIDSVCYQSSSHQSH
jgi:hypothetical protein